jgi:hypothetical protein
LHSIIFTSVDLDKKCSFLFSNLDSHSMAAREVGLWGGAPPEIYKGNKENIFFKCVKCFIKDIEFVDLFILCQ